ncbi:hypothetical protein F4801DRAFT_571386 [Xylaria longipes]|nr:hypothetical protein F4801DRAFT_571386 [Xylaria longipes]
MLILLRPMTLLGFVIPQYKDSRYPGPSNPDRTATALDFPERSIPYVQDEDEREVLERERQEAPNTSTVPPKARRTRVPGDKPEHKMEARSCGIQFAEDAQHSRGRRAKGKAPATVNLPRAQHRDTRRRDRSPYPSREPETRQKAIPISNKKNVFQRDATRLEDDTASRIDDTDDDDRDNNGHNDDSNQDVAMEGNPLANHPRIGQSLEHPKPPIKAAGAQMSLLTEGLRRYARLCEDGAFAGRVQAAVEYQGRFSRRQKSILRRLRKEGEKTKIPAYRKRDGPSWGFDMADPGCDGTTVFGEAVISVYRDDSRA